MMVRVYLLWWWIWWCCCWLEEFYFLFWMNEWMNKWPNPMVILWRVKPPVSGWRVSKIIFLNFMAVFKIKIRTETILYDFHLFLITSLYDFGAKKILSLKVQRFWPRVVLLSKLIWSHNETSKNESD
jgi:hypothetical protein